MANLFTRLEINVLDNAIHPLRVSEFVVKHSCPAIVTLPQFVAPFMADRSAKRGGYKIIVAVDFENGRNFAMQKLRDLPKDAMSADGFDIMATPNISGIQAQNEVKALKDFINSMNPVAEIRWVLDVFNRKDEDVVKHLMAVKACPPNFVRMDRKLTQADAKLDHVAKYDFIRKHAVTPIKVSGNVTVETMRALMKEKTTRFDVTMSQAMEIAKAPHEQKKKETPEVKQETKQEAGAEGEEKIVGTLGQDVQ